MCRKLFFLLPVFLCLRVQASPLKPHAIYDFSKGLDSYHSSLSLPDGFVHNCDNVLFDSQAPVTKRQGFTVAFTTKGYSGQAAWAYTDQNNTSWIIERTSDSIIANNISGSASVLIATVSANNLVGEANAFGNAYFVDQTQGVYFWNGSTVTYVGSSPKGSLMAQWHGRLWVAGLAVPNGNQLYGSKQYDGITWATGLNPNDPVILTVGLQDNFDNISALYPFLDTLYTFKHFLTYAVYGFDQTNFQISFITQECGCIDQQSIQTFGASLKFVSERGVENFDGYTCTRISDPVKNLVDASIQAQGGVNTQSWVQSNLSDWAAGTFSQRNNISTMTVSPAMQWRGAGSDYSASDFNSETLTGLTYYPTVGVQISTSPAYYHDPADGNFEDTAPGGISDGWSYLNSAHQTAYSSLHCNITPKAGSYFLIYTNPGGLLSSNVDFRILRCADNSVITDTVKQTTYTGSCSWVAGLITGIGSAARECAYISIKDTSSNVVVATSTYFMYSGTDMGFYYTPDALVANNGPIMAVDLVTNGTLSNTNSMIQSRTFDTGKITSTVIPKVPWTIVGTTPTFVLQNSTDSVTWSNVTTSTGVSTVVNRYVRYLSTWTFSPLLDFQSSWQSADIQPFIFVSTWTSPCHNIGAITSWGSLPVTEDLTGGAAIAFTLCSSANSNCVPSTCTVISPNSQITITTNSYVQAIATFTAVATTQTATLNSFTVQWFSGNRAAPMASTVWDNRYWLSLTTTTTDSFNDAVLVLSAKGSWSLFDIHAGGLVQYKNSLYHTDSLSSGNTYLDNQGYNDNGAAINAFIQTKDYCEEGPTQEDYYESLYPSMDNLGNYSMSISYQMDRDPTSYALSSILQTEFSNTTSIKIPFLLNATNQNFGKCINYTFTESDLSSPWNFYGFTSYFHERDVQ